MSNRINRSSISPRMLFLRKFCKTRIEMERQIRELEAIPGLEDAVALMKKAFVLHSAAHRLAQTAPHSNGRINGQVPNEEEIRKAKRQYYERKQAKLQAQRKEAE